MSDIDKPKHPHGRTRDRLEWLRAWAATNPTESTRAAQEAVQAHFGRGVGNAAANEIMRQAHLAHEVAANQAASGVVVGNTSPETSDEMFRRRMGLFTESAGSIALIIHAMKMAGITSITLLPDGTANLGYAPIEQIKP